VGRFGWVVVVNVGLIAAAVVLTVFVNRHLSAEIHNRRANFGSCARQIREKIARTPIKLRTRRRSAATAKTIRAECGWANLSARRPADAIGTAFGIVALGLFDFLLWRIWRPETK
jgi:hypothetical protein